MGQALLGIEVRTTNEKKNVQYQKTFTFVYSLSAEISLEVVIVTTENLSKIHIMLTIKAGILIQP